MGRLYDRLSTFWAEVGLPAQPLGDDLTGFQISDYPGENGRWRLIVLALENEAQIVCYSIAPLLASQKYLPTVAEFVDRVNFGLIMGNFELDWDDGEIRFRTSTSAAGIELSTKYLTQLVMHNLVTFDHYLPWLQAVADGDLSPRTAIEQSDSAE